MNIGLLNIRITFQKNLTRKDAIGNHINVWRDYYTCWATASVSKTATETDDAAHISEQNRLNFTVRYCAETQVITSSGYRIMFNGKIYNIDSMDCMNYKKKSLKFTAHLVER